MIRQVLALFTLALAAATPAIADDLELAAEHATVVRLPGMASAVVVGNPSIADAMVHDGRTLVITGRLQGRTNVIAVDQVGRVIYSQEIVVTNPVAGQVALFRGPQRRTLSCGEVCDEVPRTGDEAQRTDELTAQQQLRLSVADAAVGGDPSQGN